MQFEISIILLRSPTYRFEALKEDYANMSEMMFGPYPEFDDLMSFIQKLEDEINGLMD